MNKLWLLGILTFIISCGPPNPRAWRVRSIDKSSNGGKCIYYFTVLGNSRSESSTYFEDACDKWDVGDTLIFKSKSDETYIHFADSTHFKCL